MSTETYKPIPYDINSDNFQKSELPQFSPFRIVEIKAVAAKTKAGRDYTKYTVVITPVQNSSIRLSIDMSRQDLDAIRSQLKLSKDAKNAAINATNGVNDAKGYKTLIFSLANTPN